MRPRHLIAVALVLLATIACTTLKGNGKDWKRGEDGLDHRLSRFSYIEEGKLVGLAVDGQAARYREETPFFPLQVAVANKGLTRLTVKRESFWLIDEEGNRYPLATLGELRDAYGQVRVDRRFAENFVGVLLSRWPNYTDMPSNLFPEEGGGIRTEFVELHKFAWFADFLYFPHPKTGVVGHRFELWMDAEELEDPVFVKFKID